MWIEAFINYLRYERGYSENTITAYSEGLETFEQYFKSLDDSLSWEVVDEDIVRDWLMLLIENGSSPSTVSCRRSSVRSFYKFLLRRGIVQRDPTHLIAVPKKEKALPVYVREEQMNRLLDGNFFDDSFAGLRDKMILLTFYSTGMRLSELTGLRLTDVDNKLCQMCVLGKRDKQRIIPFGEEMRTQINQYLQERQLLLEEQGAENNRFFVNEKTGAKMSKEQVYTIVHRYLAQVTSLKKRSPHVLRHSFATSMLNNHADLQSVKELLGHESLSTTEIYTHTSFIELRNMYNTAHPRAPKK